MRIALRIALVLICSSIMYAAPTPLVPPGSPLTAALADARVVAALHRLAAREGAELTRITRRTTPTGVVLTFHARRGQDGERARLDVELADRVVVRVDAREAR